MTSEPGLNHLRAHPKMKLETLIFAKIFKKSITKNEKAPVTRAQSGICNEGKANVGYGVGGVGEMTPALGDFSDFSKNNIF